MAKSPEEYASSDQLISRQVWSKNMAVQRHLYSYLTSVDIVKTYDMFFFKHRKRNPREIFVFVKKYKHVDGAKNWS
jgi:hypothetical protein